MGYSLYLVGGFVRDLLLGVANLDLDLVVEGDAVELVRRLATEAGGQVRVHERFGTARWQPPGAPAAGPGAASDALGAWPALDFVTARREFYEQAEALPSVEASSLRQDLYRRDFTVNTMALRLERRRLGELVDYYGGQRDLERRIIRVLHNFSFVEDATRMIRAARLEQRLGFTIESRTSELIAEALDLLGRLSGERLRHELYLVLAEGEPAKSLARLAELRVLDRLMPAAPDMDVIARRFTRAAAEWPSWCRGCLQPVQKGMPVLQSVYLALLAYHLSPADLERFMLHLRIVTGNGRLLREVAQLRRRIPDLAAGAGIRSRVYGLLHGFSPAALFVARVAERDEVRTAIDLYYDDLRDVKPLLDGQALRSVGVPAGPAYARILAAVLSARLDGEVITLEDERLLAAGLAADLAEGATGSATGRVK
jgi:tRNA nucleotidyltransferase (CCA-adding enzyme)